MEKEINEIITRLEIDTAYTYRDAKFDLLENHNEKVDEHRSPSPGSVLIEDEIYLLKLPTRIRIATFNGFGSGKGWGGMDWSGDSGHSTDSWMHDEIEWFFLLDKLAVFKIGKEVTNLGINQS